MKATIEYLDGKTEDKEGFYRLHNIGNRLALRYENDEEIGTLEIPKSAIKEIRITNEIEENNK